MFDGSAASSALMSAPFGGPPALPFDTDRNGPAAPSPTSIQDELAARDMNHRVAIWHAGVCLGGVLSPARARHCRVRPWEKRRPLGVMIENSSAARPQSGLSSADVVYEAVAEGGITRFMAVFLCQDTDPIGPVRSARTYYLDWISEYGASPLYAHVGGANTPGPADALGQIERYGWGAYNDLNQFSVGFPTFWRDYDRLGANTATEHTVYTSTQKAWAFAAAKRQLTNVETDDRTGKTIPWDQNFVKWTFKDDAPVADRPAAGSRSSTPSAHASSLPSSKR